jgi:hypothetical protein
MNDIYYKESPEGVHVMHLDCMDEGTLCGIGCDNPELKNTRKKIVTCPKCIYIIEALMTVKYNKIKSKYNESKTSW